MSNYSYETSLPSYHENAVGKKIQADIIYSIILQKNPTCLKAIEKVTGLPQSTISARINGLIVANKVAYKGTGVYENRKRKLIVPIKAEEQAA